ncbi:MAG: metalloregulator ArsR/SmtB family transcription factor [Anaerolineae bacterium]|jgi:ArsR family transcriptional regulator
MNDECQETAELFQLLSHPARLEILNELRRDPACVCHLQAVLDRPQAYVSQQLRVLREANVVTDQRDGLFVTYRLADRQVERLLDEVLGPPAERTVPDSCPCPRCEDESGRC